MTCVKISVIGRLVGLVGFDLFERAQHVSFFIYFKDTAAACLLT